mgnify:CR=1 FL=1
MYFVAVGKYKKPKAVVHLTHNEKSLFLVVKKITPQ